MSDLPDNVVRMFWWKYLRPKRPPTDAPKSTDQKIAEALAKWGSHKREDENP